MVWCAERKSQENRTGLSWLYGTWVTTLHGNGSACSQNDFYRLSFELTSSDWSCYLIRYFESNANKWGLFFFLISKLNKNLISLNAPFISLGRIKLSSFLMWKQYTWPVLVWNAIVKMCNAFVYFFIFTIRVAACTLQSNTAFYGTDRWSQRGQERKTRKNHPPASFQDSPVAQ